MIHRGRKEKVGQILVFDSNGTRTDQEKSNTNKVSLACVYVHDCVQARNILLVHSHINRHQLDSIQESFPNRGICISAVDRKHVESLC